MAMNESNKKSYTFILKYSVVRISVLAVVLTAQYSNMFPHFIIIKLLIRRHHVLRKILKSIEPG
jgi:hypothetical protein